MTSEAKTDAAKKKLALFEGDSYPSQLREKPASGFHGEYRGFYPGASWKPASSRYEGRANKTHKGLDIYAPFAPQPLETPVLALADGDLSFRAGSRDPDDLGNRAELRANGVVLSYGHLSRFEGRGGKIEMGDVIGYAGCSGNADTQGECRTCGTCNVNSGHVHLSVRQKTATSNGEEVAVNPVPHYPLSLRFATDADLGKEMSCAAFVKDHGLEVAWEPPAPKLGELLGREEMNWLRANRRRQPLKGDFALLEFDATALLKTTKCFYEHGVKRLDEAARFKDPKTDGDKLLAAFLDEKILKARTVLREEKALSDLYKAIVKDGAVIGLAADDKPEVVPGWLLRHISRLTQMAWLAFGGAALRELGDNSFQSEKCKIFSEKLYGRTYLDWRCKDLPECGAGIGGFAWLSATRTARNALQLTKIAMAAPAVLAPAPPADGTPPAAPDPVVPPPELPVISVSFGAGSLMHAAVSDHMKAVQSGEPAIAPAIEADIALWLGKLSASADLLAAVHRLCHTHKVLLSNEATSDTAQTRRAALLAEIGDAIKAAADAFVACPALIASDALADALIQRIARTNIALFDRLAELSLAPEGHDPIGPGFYLLEQAAP